MKFKDLETAVSGETILCINRFTDVVFIGFLNERLIVTTSTDHKIINSLTCSESEISDWYIQGKNPVITGPYYRYEYITHMGEVLQTKSYYIREHEFTSTSGTEIALTIKTSDWMRKIGSAIYMSEGIPCDEDGNTLK